MTKDEILKFVKNAGLKPADIVDKSNGLIPVTQAYDWLRTWKFSMSTLLLLEVYAKRVAGSAEIFSEPRSNSLSKEFTQRMRGEFIPGAEPVLPPLINKCDTEKLLAEKIPAKNENMKKEPSVVTALKDFADTIDVTSKGSLDKLNKFVEAANKNATPATPTNFASWGANGTMKRVGNIVKLNVNDKSYTIDFEKAKSGFLVDGKEYKLSDFTEVK